MRFILIVEGDTEKRSIESLIRNSIKIKTDQNIGVDAINVKGFGNFKKDLQKRVEKHLTGPGNQEIIAIIGLMDLYISPYAKDVHLSLDERISMGTRELEQLVATNMFHMFFAVHEIEAWLLSDSEKFNNRIRQKIHQITEPEKVNNDEPPSHYLKKLYSEHLNRGYKKTVDGVNLMKKIDPEKVYQKCPNYRKMIDTMVSLI
jgi:hypothetical protein